MLGPIVYVVVDRSDVHAVFDEAARAESWVRGYDSDALDGITVQYLSMNRPTQGSKSRTAEEFLHERRTAR